MFVIAAVAGLGGGTLVASPAHASPQPLFGTTVDVIAQPSTDSLLGGTAYVPASGGALMPTLASTLGSDVLVEILDGASVAASCTIPTGDLTCSMNTAGLFANGANDITAQFTMSATTTSYSGTVFVVTNTAPTFAIEWRDASGAWIDGSGTSLPLFGNTTLRCVITNNSNAPIQLSSVNALIASGSITIPVTGTLQPNETGRYEVWSGPAGGPGAVSCTGGVSLRDGTGAGGGNGGTAVGVTGTITVSPQPAPGRTVTITGDAIQPPIVTEFSILLNGVPVAGSPVTTVGPDFDFVIDVPIPSNLPPGTQTISVVTTYQGQQIVYAQFSFEVEAPALADTGAADAPLGVVALALLAAGTALVLTRRSTRGSRIRA